MSSRSLENRGVLYTRDSEGRHDQTAPQYVSWAIARAAELGVTFSGSPEQIHRMISLETPVEGDIYLDYGIKGNKLSRPALDRLKRDIRQLNTISHVFIPRRDRLARPDQAIDGLQLEMELRAEGVTVVFMDKILDPIKKGTRQEITELITGLLDYHVSGTYREDLSQKMLLAQLELASNGHSTGGRAPYGFRRNLIRDDGTIVRELNDGEIVRQRGHHVVWLPGPDHEVKIVLLIIAMLRVMSATRVAKELTARGIPSPNAGRVRKDNGIRHVVRDEWHSNTVKNIACNRLIQGVVSHGHRSMGDQRRFTADGPRRLNDSDFRADGKPKIIRNDTDQLITVKARFEPLIPSNQYDELMTILDARGGTQRGKPRSREPERNPLGGRIFDMECGWPMYRVPAGASFRYKCGLYQQSHAQSCNHNHVDGPTITRFALAAIRQICMQTSTYERLRAKLHAKATELQCRQINGIVSAASGSELKELRSQLKTALKNWTLAPNEELRSGAEEVIEELKRQIAALEKNLPSNNGASAAEIDASNLVEAALDQLSRLPQLANNPTDLAKIGELFQQVNLQVFLRFRSEQQGQQKRNRLVSGILTFGNAAAPIQKYTGPTGRRGLALLVTNRHKSSAENDLRAEKIGSDSKAKSLGNVNRENRSPIELFLADVAGWEPHIIRLVQAA